MAELAEVDSSPMCISSSYLKQQGSTHASRKADLTESRLPAKFWMWFAQLRMDLEVGGWQVLGWMKWSDHVCKLAQIPAQHVNHAERMGSTCTEIRHATCTSVAETFYTSHGQPPSPKAQTLLSTSKARLLFLHNNHLAPHKPSFCHSLVVTQTLSLGYRVKHTIHRPVCKTGSIPAPHANDPYLSEPCFPLFK